MHERAFGTNGTNGTTRMAGNLPLPDMTIARRIAMPIYNLPLQVFGPEAGPWVRDAAESKSAAVDYVGLCMLVGVAGLVGARRLISPWSDWEEPCILWGALVGRPKLAKITCTRSCAHCSLCRREGSER